MNILLLQPNDVLFFRDGRPMTGSLAGHGAAWPMPNVINAALHAALHRSGLAKDAHFHRRGGRCVYQEDAQRDRKFGSLVTAGPFPVRDGNTWFFPRPLDLQDATLQPALLPDASFDSLRSSLAVPLEYAVANQLQPSKNSGAKTWLSQAAYDRYLDPASPALLDGEALNDSDFADTEHAIGIGIDPTTGSQDGKRIYAAHYLRLREDWQLGVCAAADDKEFNHAQHGKDLVKALLNGGQHEIIVGGQQRICSARLVAKAPPLPRGKADGFNELNGKWLVKWILLSPAVWPAIEVNVGRNISMHPGGSLPNWIDPRTGAVLLKSGDTARGRQSREAWRQRVRQQPGIAARLVASLIPKPLVVSGWALPDEAGGTEAERNGGAQSTHLAVPAGAVYYFEAEPDFNGGPGNAIALAAALNWHGSETAPTTIRNRRSALLGEKGFGLGVCGTWEFFPDVGGRSTQ